MDYAKIFDKSIIIVYNINGVESYSVLGLHLAPFYVQKMSLLYENVRQALFVLIGYFKSKCIIIRQYEF